FRALAALGPCALFANACRGGPDTSADAGVEAAPEPSSTDLAPSGADASCATAIVTIDDVEAREAATGAGPACFGDEDCTVRFAGDYCACPTTPRPMSRSRVAAFDERLAGISARCTCDVRPCQPPALPRVECV